MRKGSAKDRFTHEKLSIAFGDTASDHTARYHIRILKPITVGEFFSFLLGRKEEWGMIRIFTGPYPFERFFWSWNYRHGELLDDFFPEGLSGCKIQRITGHGGWTFGSFDLHLGQVEFLVERKDLDQWVTVFQTENGSEALQKENELTQGTDLIRLRVQPVKK